MLKPSDVIFPLPVLPYVKIFSTSWFQFGLQRGLKYSEWEWFLFTDLSNYTWNVLQLN